MDSYVYRNFNSYRVIFTKIKELIDFEVLVDEDGYLLFNENINVNINKKYTSIKVKNPSYNICELKKIIIGR